MRRCCALLLLLVALALPAGAQASREGAGASAASSAKASSQPKVSWGYDIDFLYYFDNREFDASEPYLLRSGTTHAAVLVPTVSARIEPSKGVRHSLTLGVDLQHDMGSQTWGDLLREGILYYDGRVATGRGVFEGVAGIYPRRLMRGWYSEAFFSDLNLFADRNFEGVLLKWRGSRFYTEAALDWLGARGYDSKERFQVISAGAWAPTRWLSLGWAADYYHYAGSELAPGVVDHGLLQPWAKADLAPGTGWQELSLRAGAILSYQWDRRRYDARMTPWGGEVTLRVKRWGVALENNTYFGGDLLPLYDGEDLAGHPYADNLYFGHRFYTGFYDRVALSWERRVGRFLRLKIGARAHFTATGYMGWQQTASLRFDLSSTESMRKR